MKAWMGLQSSAVLGALIAVLALPPAPARAGSAAGPLTNAAIVEMTKAHLSVPVILEQIRSRPGRYALEASDLIKLKKQGVADEVILAMQKKGQDGESASTAQPSKSKQVKGRPVSDDLPDGVWQPVERGEIGSPCQLSLRMKQRFRLGTEKGRVRGVGTEKGMIEAVAYCGCSADPDRRRTIGLAYGVELPVGQPHALKWNPPAEEGYFTTQTKVATSWYGDLYAVEEHAVYGKPWISVAVRVDDRLVRRDHGFHQNKTPDNEAQQRIASSELLRPGSFVLEIPLQDPPGRESSFMAPAEFAPFKIRTGELPLRRLVAMCGMATGYYSTNDRGSELPPTDQLRYASDGFVLGAAWSRMGRELHQVGSDVYVDQSFGPRIAEFVEWHGMFAGEYEKEIALIAELASRCVKLDPKKAKKLPLQQLENGTEVENLEALGEELAACQQPARRIDVSAQAGNVAHRHMWMQVEPRDEPPLWRKARLFRLSVGFYPLEGDPAVEPGDEPFLDAYLGGVLAVWKVLMPKDDPKVREFNERQQRERDDQAWRRR